LEGGINMSDLLREQLKMRAKKNGLNIKPKHTKNLKQRKDKLTYSDIEDLMGIRRPRYRRGKGGAFKQR
jgi:hypothetical protein